MCGARPSAAATLLARGGPTATTAKGVHHCHLEPERGLLQWRAAIWRAGRFQLSMPGALRGRFELQLLLSVERRLVRDYEDVRHAWAAAAVQDRHYRLQCNHIGRGTDACAHASADVSSDCHANTRTDACAHACT